MNFTDVLYDKTYAYIYIYELCTNVYLMHLCEMTGAK